MALFPRLTSAFVEARTSVVLGEIVSLGEDNEPLPKGQAVPQCRVYVKAQWDDEWTLEQHAHPLATVWALSPQSLGSAEINWTYGRGLRTGEIVFGTVYPIGATYLIKIEWDSWYGITTSTWYGMVARVNNELGGVQKDENDFLYRTGRQRLQCVSLVKVLLDTPIRFSAYWDEDSETIKHIERGLTFNQPGPDGLPRGNRSHLKHDGSYLFSNEVDDGDFWSIKDIVEYLCIYNSPRDKAGVDRVSFTISEDSLSYLGAGSFRPVIETEGNNLKQILDQLITPERLLAYTIDVNDDGELELIVYSLYHGADPLAIDGQLLALPNARKLDIAFDTAIGDAFQLTDYLSPAERVRIRGARATSTFSISHADDTLVKKWATSLETVYEAGASGWADYSTPDDSERKQRLNAAVRGRSDLRTVYALFGIPNTWDGTAKNGVGAGAAVSVFNWTSELEDFQFYNREVYLDPMTPLLTGYDYTNQDHPEPSGDGDYQPLPPLVVIANDAGQYYNIEQIGRGAIGAQVHNTQSYAWSASVNVPHQSRNLYLPVQGEAQHILDKNGFSPLPVDDNHGAWEWENIIATVTVQWDVFCEGAWPATKGDLPNTDYVREVVLYAGDNYRLDWLAAGTVVGLETADGTLQRAYAGMWLQDDRKKLLERAKLAFEWLRRPRQALTFNTCRITREIRLGDLIRYFGELLPVGFQTNSQSLPEVNCVVSEIRIEAPMGDLNNPPPAPRIVYVTDFIERPYFF
jgi:hypothetical protein